MLGYVHTPEAIEKMKSRFIDPTNHPMYGKNHTLESRQRISKATQRSGWPSRMG
jgi:hypothetical protein